MSDVCRSKMVPSCCVGSSKDSSLPKIISAQIWNNSPHTHFTLLLCLFKHGTLCSWFKITTISKDVFNMFLWWFKAFSCSALFWVRCCYIHSLHKDTVISNIYIYILVKMFHLILSWISTAFHAFKADITSDILLFDPLIKSVIYKLC